MKNNITKFYEKNYKNLIKMYNNADIKILNKLFDEYIKKSNKVLDIGFGSGRDLKYIKNLSAKVFGVESCEGFIENLEKEIYFKNRVYFATLPNLKLNLNFKFDVIISIAVFMHLSKSEIQESIKNIKKYLKNGGVVIISYSIGKRKNDERFFENLSIEFMRESFEKFEFREVKLINNSDALSREIEWVSQVFKLM